MPLMAQLCRAPSVRPRRESSAWVHQQVPVIWIGVCSCKPASIDLFFSFIKCFASVGEPAGLWQPSPWPPRPPAFRPSLSQTADFTHIDSLL